MERWLRLEPCCCRCKKYSRKVKREGRPLRKPEPAWLRGVGPRETREKREESRAHVEEMSSGIESNQSPDV